MCIRDSAQGVHEAADGGLVVAGFAGAGAPALGQQRGVGHGANGGAGAVEAGLGAVVGALGVLQDGGPTLGGPLVDTLTGSRT